MEKVRLKLEVGGLNSNIQQQQKLKSELNAQLKVANEALNELRNEIKRNVEPSNMADQLSMQQQQMAAVQAELTDALSKLDDAQVKIKQLESQREKSLEMEAQYQRRQKALKEELDECNVELTGMRNRFDELQDTMRMEKHGSQKHINMQQQLQHNCQILQAKYNGAKEEIARCEQKLKDHRLEMEGKLEKMKSKMVSAYLVCCIPYAVFFYKLISSSIVN